MRKLRKKEACVINLFSVAIVAINILILRTLMPHNIRQFCAKMSERKNEQMNKNILFETIYLICSYSI